MQVPAETGKVFLRGSVIRSKANELGTSVELDTSNQPDMPSNAPGVRMPVGFNSRDLLLLEA